MAESDCMFEYFRHWNSMWVIESIFDYGEPVTLIAFYYFTLFGYRKLHNIRPELKEVMVLIREKRYKIGNIDSTICLQIPKIGPYIPEMQKVIAESMGIDADLISIKNTLFVILFFYETMEIEKQLILIGIPSLLSANRGPIGTSRICMTLYRRIGSGSECTHLGHVSEF